MKLPCAQSQRTFEHHLDIIVQKADQAKAKRHKQNRDDPGIIFHIYLDFGILNIPVLFFIVIGVVNGANFTDGLDGLESSVTVLIATFFTVVAIGEWK